MRTFRRVILLSVCLIVCLGVSALPAQTTSGSDRLFRAFELDAAVIPNQWWEGSLEFAGDGVDSTVAGLTVALQPYGNFEIGGRFGFGETDTPGRFQEGSGATDLDIWGKWSLGSVGSGGNTELAVGGLVTVPTGDDAAGLGQDSFGLGLFGAMRHRLRDALFAAHLGVRYNEDGQTLLVPLDGKTSVLVGLGIIIPITDRLGVVGEANLETERFEVLDDDFSILGGVNWRLTNRGIFRGALALGVTDGAPDTRVVAGYAYTF